MKIKTPAATTSPATTPKKNATAPVKAKSTTPEPKATAKVVKETGATADTAAKPPSKHIGRTSGMRVMQYQDHVMAQQMKNKLTDEELATNWQTEFPDTRCRFEERMDIVKGVRKLFNQRRHGKQEIFAPEGVVIPKFVIENGKRVAVADEPSKRGKNTKDAAPLAKAS